MDSQSFIKSLKQHHNIKSDYAISKLLGVKPQTVSQWQHKMNGIGDKTAERIAELLELPYEYVLLCVMAERTKHPNAKKSLLALANKILKQHRRKST